MSKKKITMSIAVSRSTKQMIGYWAPKSGIGGITVVAYAVDDLEKKFKKALELYESQKDFSTKKVAEGLRNSE